MPDIQEFQNRPLRDTYAVVFIDGIIFKIREEGFSKEVSVYIPLGINLEGKKEVLGYWIGELETSKYWLSVFDDLKRRVLKNILIMGSDNLPGISQAVSTAYPKTKIQNVLSAKLEIVWNLLDMMRRKNLSKIWKKYIKQII